MFKKQQEQQKKVAEEEAKKELEAEKMVANIGARIDVNTLKNDEALEIDDIWWSIYLKKYNEDKIL